MDAAERDALIAQYRKGTAAVDAALDAITEDELDRQASPDEWSARMVCHHLADSEANASIRLRHLIADDEPVIQGYSEESWAERLAYDRPIEASLAVFRAVRASTSELLDRIPDWARAGTHTESGRYSIEDWLRIYAAHAHDHADQIRRARA
jgi:DinB superfamily